MMAVMRHAARSCHFTCDQAGHKLLYHEFTFKILRTVLQYNVSLLFLHNLFYAFKNVVLKGGSVPFTGLPKGSMLPKVKNPSSGILSSSDPGNWRDGLHLGPKLGRLGSWNAKTASKIKQKLR